VFTYKFERVRDLYNLTDVSKLRDFSRSEAAMYAEESDNISETVQDN